MKIDTFLFPSQLSALVLQSNQRSPLVLCQGCSGVASVPETSVICVLSLSLMVFRKMLLLWWGNVTQSQVSAALFSCGPAELLELWVLRASPPSTLKNQMAWDTVVLKYLLLCWGAACSSLPLHWCVPRASKHRKQVGAASSASGKELHLQWTCSLCFMQWNHENCVFGQSISKQCYKGFFKEKKEVQD